MNEGGGRFTIMIVDFLCVSFSAGISGEERKTFHKKKNTIDNPGNFQSAFCALELIFEVAEHRTQVQNTIDNPGIGCSASCVLQNQYFCRTQDAEHPKSYLITLTLKGAITFS